LYGCYTARKGMTAPPPESGTPSVPLSKVLTARTRLWIAAALAIIAIAIYSDSIANGFTLDSSFILLRDPRIQKVTADNLRLILTKDYWYPSFNSGLYRPFTTLTFLFNYAVLGNGGSPLGYHLVNLLLHIGNAWLLFALAWRFLRRLWPAFFAAALWAAHPIATEAVANLVGRCDELAAMAILGGVLLYIHSAPFAGWRRWLAVAALFSVSLLGLLSKELAAGLIGMMVLWDLVRGPNQFREWMERRWPYYAGVMASLAIFATARILVFRAAPPAEFPIVDNPLVAAPFWAARLTAFKVLLADLRLLVFPLNLSSDRSYNQIPLAAGFDLAAWGGMVIAVLLLAVAVARRRRDPLMFWCAGFFGIALLPVSNLAIVIGSIMAERFLYLPAAAFAIAATVLIYRSPLRHRAPIVLSVAIALFGVRTFLRNPDWKDDYALSTHDVRIAPASFKLHSMAARTLFERNVSNIDEAISEAEKAWDIVGRLPPAQVFTQTPTNLGALYRVKGDTAGGPRTPGGAEWYRRSVRVLEQARRDSQISGDAYDNLQEANGKPMAVRLERADLYLNLGFAYHGLGLYEQARDAFIYGRKLMPSNPDFYSALAANYLDGGNPTWAAISLQEELMLDGAQPNTVNALRAVLAKIPGTDCVLQVEGGKTKLNVACPASNICLTWTDLAQTYFKGRQRADALFLKRSALERGCPAELLDFAAPGQ
jgi:protein O-mannosyl-transferase